MSTTVVLAALAGNRLYILHLGDSRAYLHRNGQLHQLTTDHTWAQAAVAAGTLSAAEAAHHPGRNQLQRYLGSNRQINVARAVLSPDNGYAEEYILVQPGDRILLCSDGVYHRLEHRVLEAIANTGKRPQDTVDMLVQKAIDQGEIDDITALIFTVPTEQAGTELLSAAASNLSSDHEATVPVDQASFASPSSGRPWIVRAKGWFTT
ncbi:MAG: protein phosphatase 2C domain-containing protein [Caldilineaceae bacterium]